MKKLVLAAMVACLVVGFQSTSQALSIKLIDGINIVTVNDGGLGDANGAVGQVTYIGPVGPNWTLNVTTGTSKPATGNAIQFDVDLNSVNSTSLGAGSVQILLTDTGFANDTGANLVIGGTLASGGTATFSAFYDAANVAFAETTQIGDTLYALTSGGFNFSTNGPIASGSLTIDATINHTIQGTSSFDAQLTPVPEPTSMLLLGLGLLGIALARRKK